MYLEKFRLTGQTAFITGGGRGIGLAAAEAPLEAGANVIISDLDEVLLGSGRDYLGSKGFSVDAVQLDVTRPDDGFRSARSQRKIWVSRRHDSQRRYCMARHSRRGHS
jgi:NAD(P)-dependent dehydrogenase (short-subunit alcohol dehydrogenase family)